MPWRRDCSIYVDSSRPAHRHGVIMRAIHAPRPEAEDPSSTRRGATGSSRRSPGCLRHCGGYPKFLDTTLVLPTAAHFPGARHEWPRRRRGRVVPAACAITRAWRTGPCTVEPRPRASPALETDWFAGQGAGHSPMLRGAGSYRRVGAGRGRSRASFARYLMVRTFEEPRARRRGRCATRRWRSGRGVHGLRCVPGELRDECRPASDERGRAGARAGAVLPVAADAAEAADEYLNPHLRKYLRLAVCDLARYETRFAALRGAAVEDPAERTLPVRVS